MVDRDLDLWPKQRYVAAWRRALSRYAPYISYNGTYQVPGAEDYLFTDAIRSYFVCPGTVIEADAELFSEWSCVPMIIYKVLVKRLTATCVRCWDGYDYYDDYDDDDRQRHQQRLDVLQSQKCTCVYEHVYSDAPILMLIVSRTKQLLREGWSWDYDGRKLVLYSPRTCKQCKLDECNGCEELSYEEELAMNFYDE